MVGAFIYLTTMSTLDNKADNAIYQGIIVSATEAYYVGYYKHILTPTLTSNDKTDTNKRVAFVMAISASQSCIPFTDSEGSP